MGALCLRLFSGFRLLLGDDRPLRIPYKPADAGGGDRRDEQRNGGEWRHRKKTEESADEEERHRLGCQLGRDLHPDVLVAARSSDDETCGDRDDERRNLRHQPVPDRQHSEDSDRLTGRPVMHQHRDREATEDVHDGDNDAGDRIATDKFRGTIHRPVEVGFTSDLFTSRTGIRL